jgi:hypothetical protein
MTDHDNTNKDLRSEEKKQITAMKAFVFVCELGFVIAVPILAFGFIGKWLDARYHTRYWTLLGILLAITVSAVFITRRLRELLNDIRS